MVAIDGGWELYVGGNGGVKIRAGELLVKVKTENEIIEYAEAFLQYYRETARYLERTSHWIERVGLDHVQEILKDSKKRNSLRQKMETTLSVHRDPWKEAVQDQKRQKDLYEVIEVAKLVDIPIGTGKTVRLNKEELALFHLENGDVKVIENRCPYKYGVLAEGIVSGHYVFCPMHDQKIYLCSGRVQEPDTGCVKTYPVVIEDGTIYVQLSQSEGMDD